MGALASSQVFDHAKFKGLIDGPIAYAAVMPRREGEARVFGGVGDAEAEALVEGREAFRIGLVDV